MQPRHVLRYLLFPVLLACSLPSQADLIVSRSIVEMAHGETRADLVLINSDDTETLYVQVEPYQVQSPGEDNQQLVAIAAGDDKGLLVTPNRLAIPPGGRSLVRMLSLDTEGEHERIYRINFMPVTPPVEVEPATDEDVRSKLEVVVAYQVLLIIQPQTPVAVHEHAREGIRAQFRNGGNANYLLTDGEQCNPLDAADCRQLPDHRVYPGNTWVTELPFDGPFSYRIRTHDGISAQRFD